MKYEYEKERERIKLRKTVEQWIGIIGVPFIIFICLIISGLIFGNLWIFLSLGLMVMILFSGTAFMISPPKWFINLITKTFCKRKLDEIEQNYDSEGRGMLI